MALRISAVSANCSGALSSSRLTGFELKLSIVVPVYEAGAALGCCLRALNGNADAAEVLVVDDGSTEDSAETCRSAGARLIRMETNQGAAAARNAGARAASGDYVVFIDADVVVHPDAVRRIRETIQSNPQWSAFFGSYDDIPTDKGLVGQYRNLLHHYTHQRTASPAPHFWTGIGVIKRQDFWRVGGFDETQRHLEDVELGSRLKRAGLVVHVVPDLLGTHLKLYTLLSHDQNESMQTGDTMGAAAACRPYSAQQVRDVFCTNAVGCRHFVAAARHAGRIRALRPLGCCNGVCRGVAICRRQLGICKFPARETGCRFRSPAFPCISFTRHARSRVLFWSRPATEHANNKPARHVQPNGRHRPQRGNSSW